MQAPSTPDPELQPGPGDGAARPTAFKGTSDAGGRGMQAATASDSAAARTPRRRPFRAARRRLVGALAGFAAAGASRMPPSILRTLARGVAGAVIDLQHGKDVRERLRRAFGDGMDEATVRRVAREVPRAVAETVADALVVHRRGRAWLEGRVDTSESDAWLAAHRDTMKDGFVGITAHCGNWELTARWVAQEFPGVFTHVVGKRAPNPHLNELIERYRYRITGCEVLYRDAAPSVFSRLLRSGKAIGFLPDQDVRDLPGVFVDFFGRPAYTPIGPARLAVAAGVPLAGAFLIRTGHGRYRVRMLTPEPLVPDPARPRTEEMLRLTQAYTEGIEAAIRAHPEQWPWFHDRWRTTPEKLASRGRARLEL